MFVKIRPDGDLYVSTWDRSMAGAPAAFEVTDLLQDASGRLIANTRYDGIYQSSDRGMHWQGMKGALMRASIPAIATDARGMVYATDREFTYRFHADEQLWHIIARRPVPIPVHSFACTPSGRLFAGTQNHGLWTLEQPPREPRPDESGFTLLTCHPNPSPGAITITFDIDRLATVRLTVFDLLGRAVYRDSRFCSTAGRYAFRWQAGAAAAGVYIFSLSDGKRRVSGHVLRQ